MIQSSPFIDTLYFASMRKCGTGAVIGIDKINLTMLVIPTRCKSWVCPKCARSLRYHWAHVIRRGAPQRFITLTMRPDPAKDLAAKISAIATAWSKFVQKARRTFKKFEFVRAIELTQKGVPHLHILQRGTYLPQRWLSRAWAYCGGGPVVDIRRVRSDKDAARYILKYVSKAPAAVLAAAPRTRLLTTSQHWAIKPKEPNPWDDTSSYEWSWTRLSANDVLSILNSGGACTLAAMTSVGVYAVDLSMYLPPPATWTSQDWPHVLFYSPARDGQPAPLAVP